MPRMQIDFYSKRLCSNTAMTVIFPQGTPDMLSGGIRYNARGKIPVLWLLHGLGDDHTSWTRYTRLERYALARGIAVVCPAVLNLCMYHNMAGGNPYFDFIAYELPQILGEMFPQFSTEREDNYIAGLSMGGYGALRFGLTFPERYGAIGVFSSGNLIEFDAIFRPEDYQQEWMRPFANMAKNTFGVQSMNELTGTDADVYTLYKRARAAGKPLPRICLYCGDEDFVKPLSDQLARFLQRQDPEGEVLYGTGPGAHNWDFWDQWLPAFLEACGLTPLVQAAQISEVKRPAAPCGEQ